MPGNRYRDTYQVGGHGDRGRGWDSAHHRGVDLGYRGMGRVEAAHLVLTLFSKLDVCWNRVPTRLPGWEGSLR